MKDPKERIVRRFSIGLTAQEWVKLEKALAVCYHASPGCSVWDQVGVTERNSFVTHAIWAVATAVLKQGHSFAPLACDLRFETPEEIAERLGEPGPGPEDPWLFQRN